MVRLLLPARVRRALLARFDARYITKQDHRQDLRDALWEMESLKREVVTLRREVERLRQAGAKAGKAAPDPGLAGKVADASRLATETAASLDHLLQNEVLVWQAIDELKSRSTP
jgi:hypothetical protein